MDVTTAGDGGAGGGAARCRLQAMATGELDRLWSRLQTFRETWERQDPRRALAVLERFREALERHTRWEEESLFEELECRCAEEDLRAVNRHHRQHLALIEQARHLADMIARLSEPAVSRSTAELERGLLRLEHELATHVEVELREVCTPLDAVLPEGDIDMIAEELEERGRPRY